MNGDCEHPHLTPESLRELQALGLSSRFFVGYFITLMLAFVLVWCAAIRECAAQYHTHDPKTLRIAVEAPAQLPSLPAAVEVAA